MGTNVMRGGHFLVGAVLGSLLLGSMGETARAVVMEEDFRLRTTRDLYDVCSVTQDDPNYVAAIYACRGFIEGAVQYHDAVTDRQNLRRLVCYTEDATIETGRMVFNDWAQANLSNAERMQEEPVVGLVRALAQRYPCS